MSEADGIFDELTNTLSRWGLDEIPFTESASSLFLNFEKCLLGVQKNSEKY